MIDIDFTRYSDPDPQLLKFKRPCQHNTRAYKCKLVTNSDVRIIRSRLYKHKTKIDQEKYLCRYLAVAAPVRKRKVNKPGVKSKSHRISIIYNLPRPKKSIGCVPVCRNFFLDVCGVNRNRILRIARNLHEGEIFKENRGGDQISHKSAEKKERIKEFIRNLPAKESHYNRKKSCRIYLSSDLSIRKLAKIYTTSSSEKVSYFMFRNVFLTKFNIGFASPASDICTFCLRSKNQISVERDPIKKQILITERRIHPVKAKAFYQYTKEEPENTVSYCFDLQQVQPLPKTPIQEAFYARQLSFYSLCVVDMKAQNPTFYVWSEDQAARGANEVGSALFNHLSSLDLEQIRYIRLFCDGCGGQNKNSHIVHILMYWLLHKAPNHLETITLFFPVRGHSFLPADRVFGRVERLLRKHPLITLKTDYIKHYSEVGTVKELGREWNLYNVKILEEYYKKIAGISEMKRIIFKKFKNQKTSTEYCKIKTLVNYKYESDADIFKTICKRGKRENNIFLEELPCTGRAIKEEKKKDLRNLLSKQFGKDWEKNVDNLKFYVNLLNNEETVEVYDPEEGEEDPSEACNCLDDEIPVHI